MVALKTTAALMSLVFLLPVDASAAEPTEGEMLAAFKTALRNYDRGVEKLAKGCDYMDQTQNPVDAIACMMGKIGQAGNAMGKISIKGFEKLGCEKAQGAGYLCTYNMQINQGARMGGALSDIGGVGTKQFIQTKHGWIVH